MQAQPMDTAAWFLDNITPTNTVESNELAVWDVYFRTFAIDSFALSAADSAKLFNIAYQSGSEGGIGVYMARIMLNLDVDLGESNKTDEEYLTEEETEGIKSFILFPNPAKDEVSIMFQGYEEGENILIELFDITGRKNISKQVYLSGNILTINTAHLEKGIYLYRIDTGSGDSGKGKLIIAR
ncbi:MAG: hypothetical protein POELPBGB_01660 [Bacteroidia bacterium]|nr:hypothetical protein [Bacteroidia bacterium]